MDRSPGGPARRWPTAILETVSQESETTRDAASGGRSPLQPSLCRMFAVGISLEPPNRSASFSNSS
jgi:hypothetical protein